MAWAFGPCSASTDIDEVAIEIDDVGVQPEQVFGPVIGVDDDHPFVGQAVDEDIIDNRAICVAEIAVFGVPHLHLAYISGLDVLQKHFGIRPHQSELAHVVDIEKSGRGAGGRMFGVGAGGILHRQFVTGEGNHAPAHRHVLVVQCCAFNFCHFRPR